MTPQERQLVDDLFDRLSRLESSPRDAEAERAIADGARSAPNALYALVQSVLVQDEALRRADARIRELSGEDQAPATAGGFLDNMRNMLGGGHATSVPSVRPSAAGGPDPRWNSGAALANSPQSAQPYAAQTPTPGFGGSFLGTAAASAAGAIGGAMLFNSIGSLFGGHHNSGSAFADTQSASSSSPWDNSASGSDLSREAGLNDIGSGSGGSDSDRAGLFDSSDNDVDVSDNSDFGDDGDSGGDDSA